MLCPLCLGMGQRYLYYKKIDWPCPDCEGIPAPSIAPRIINIHNLHHGAYAKNMWSIGRGPELAASLSENTHMGDYARSLRDRNYEYAIYNEKNKKTEIQQSRKQEKKDKRAAKFNALGISK